MTDYTALIADIFDRRAELALEVDEELDLLAAAKAGDSYAFERLARAYAPTLRKAVGQYRYAGGLWDGSARQGHALDELRSSALRGLHEAILAFDADTHRRLAAVVTGYIADEMSSSFTAPQFTVPQRTLKRFYSILGKADGNVEQAAALAPDFEMTRETFFSVLDAVRHVESYQDLAEAGAGQTGDHDIVASPIRETGEPDVEDRLLSDAALASLTTDERRIVDMAYGFASGDPLPDAEIGHQLGLSRPKVQRLRAAALLKMRSALGVA